MATDCFHNFACQREIIQYKLLGNLLTQQSTVEQAFQLTQNLLVLDIVFQITDCYKDFGLGIGAGISKG